MALGVSKIKTRIRKSFSRTIFHVLTKDNLYNVGMSYLDVPI